jgi:hypothetical protein
VFCHSHSLFYLSIPPPAQLPFSSLFYLSIPPPAQLSFSSLFCLSHSPSTHSPFSCSAIPIPTYIPRLAKFKLKTQMAARRFEPATPQANVLVATTTPHVCLCLHLSLLLIKAVRGRLSFRVLPFPPLPAQLPFPSLFSVFCLSHSPSPHNPFSCSAILILTHIPRLAKIKLKKYKWLQGDLNP